MEPYVLRKLIDATNNQIGFGMGWLLFDIDSSTIEFFLGYKDILDIRRSMLSVISANFVTKIPHNKNNFSQTTVYNLVNNSATVSQSAGIGG